MKKQKVGLYNIKDPDTWIELAHKLLYDKFSKLYPDLEMEDVTEKFYDKVVSKIFEYGEYANLELEVDENLNITGKIIPCAKLST